MDKEVNGDLPEGKPEEQEPVEHVETNHLDMEFLKEVLSIETSSRHCEKMTDYVTRWAESNGFDVIVEPCGNVLVTKGQADKYVCFVNHMDTVHKYDNGLHIQLVQTTGKTCLVGYDDDGKSVGVGADDKAGCAIAMAVMEATDKPCKGAFFVDEEPGMLGSKQTNWDWFKDVEFGLCFDSPERNRSARSCSGHNLFNDKIFGQIQAFALKHGVTKFNYEPYTDVVQIVQHDIPCWVTGNGGYSPHTKNEYLVYEDADETYRLGLDFLETKFDFAGFKYEPPSYRPYSGYTGYAGYNYDYEAEYYRSLTEPYMVDDLNPNIVMDYDGVVVCMAADADTAEEICNALNTIAKIRAAKSKKSKKAKAKKPKQHEYQEIPDDWWDKQDVADRNEEEYLEGLKAEQEELDKMDKLADEAAERCRNTKDGRDKRSVEQWMDDLRREQLEEQNTCVDF